MVATVVLENEPSRRVKEVGPTNEVTLRVVQVGLDFGSRQPRLDEEPPEAGLHRGLGGRRQPRQGTKSAYTPATCGRFRIPTQRDCADLATTDCHVERDQGLYRRIPQAHISQRPEQVCRP